MPYKFQEFSSYLAELKPQYIKSQDVKRIKVTGSRDISEFAKLIWPCDISHRESMMGFFLNRANNVVCYAVLSIGGISGTISDTKVLLQHLLLSNASSCILVHNHPSGTLSPSQADLTITKNTKKALEIVDAVLLDHIIVTEDDYYSFSDNGTL